MSTIRYPVTELRLVPEFLSILTKVIANRRPALGSDDYGIMLFNREFKFAVLEGYLASAMGCLDPWYYLKMWVKQPDGPKDSVYKVMWRKGKVHSDLDALTRDFLREHVFYREFVTMDNRISDHEVCRLFAERMGIDLKEFVK